MNKTIKHTILFPFALLYGIVTGIRNWLFDQGILPSTSFNIPTISVGNLAVGGTGKTPHTEFLLSILQTEWKTAVLSRGYKRKTKGFYLADTKSTSQTIGDEPYQIYQKFPNVTVSVDEKRVHGVKKLLELLPGLQAIVLDDAFQHRYIQPGLSILLTDYSNLYSQDMLLPAGRLREWKSGSTRANIIVVTKCPVDMRPIDMRLFETDLKPETNQSLFFSCFKYDDLIPVFPDSIPDSWTYEKIKETNAGILLVAGIVSPKPILEQLGRYSTKISTLFFGDHHAFQSKDFIAINKQFEALTSAEKIIIVTEKDAARLVSNSGFPEALKAVTFAIPIRVKILHDQESLFIQKIKNYVVENSRNR
ncbi:MAG: tetraacyldisaccharide 4'-kinase [Paludibacter sp.]|nr:tetraacyldisaccharide 4'-kinase [Paludibacter sp.]